MPLYIDTITEINNLLNDKNNIYNFNSEKIIDKIKNENIDYPIVGLKNQRIVYINPEPEPDIFNNKSITTKIQNNMKNDATSQDNSIIYNGGNIIMASLFTIGSYYYINSIKKLDFTKKILYYVLSIFLTYGLITTNIINLVISNVITFIINLFNITLPINKSTNKSTQNENEQFKEHDLYGGNIVTDTLSNILNKINSSTNKILNNTFINSITDIIVNYLGVSKEIANSIFGLLSFITAIGGIYKFKNMILNIFTTDILTNYKILNKEINKSYFNELSLFSFNQNTGKITTIYKPNNITNILISSGLHFNINDIHIIIDTYGKITYNVGGIIMDSISYIENKPVETALVLAYLIKDKHFSHLSNKLLKNNDSTNYVFHFEDDGTLILSKKDENGKLEEVESVSMVLRQQILNESSSVKTKEKICQELFGDDNNTCNKHFYSILGRAGLNMLQNIGDAPSKESIINNLNNAEVNIKYEILKNFDWKINNKKLMVNVDEWIQILKNNNRDSIKDLGKQYEIYLNKNILIKSLLQNMVDHINNNSILLQQKYTEINEQSVTRFKRRLTDKEVSNLRAQVIIENSVLSMPNDLSLINDYKKSLNTIKESFAVYNHKLSTKTEKKIEDNIEQIEKIENELNEMYNKINIYTQTMKKDKNIIYNKNITMEDINDLINNYTNSSKKQKKYINKVTTAFGKINFLLENEDAKNKLKEMYYNI